MKRIAYIVPGFSESTDSESYRKIANFFRTKEIEPIPIKISWRHKVMSDYVEQFKSQAKIKNPDYILGFSFGAMIAFISADEIKPKTLILCSLSPYFKEDLSKIRDGWIKVVGKKRIADLEKYSFDELSKNLDSKIILIYGEKEGTELKIRIEKAHKKLKDSKIVSIPNTIHKISDEKYLNKLKDVISKLK